MNTSCIPLPRIYNCITFGNTLHVTQICLGKGRMAHNGSQKRGKENNRVSCNNHMIMNSVDDTYLILSKAVPLLSGMLGKILDNREPLKRH